MEEDNSKGLNKCEGTAFTYWLGCSGPFRAPPALAGVLDDGRASTGGAGTAPAQRGLSSALEPTEPSSTSSRISIGQPSEPTVAGVGGSHGCRSAPAGDPL